MTLLLRFANIKQHKTTLFQRVEKGYRRMSTTTDDTFRMHHDVHAGKWAGYAVTFAITFSDSAEPIVDVWATRKDANPVSNPKTVAKILPFDIWPEFAQKAFRQRVEKEDHNTTERLF